MQKNYQPSKELTLILKSSTLGCQHNITDDTDIPWQEFDWQKILRLANFHGLSCWLAEYLKDVEYVPPDIRKKLADKRRRQLLSLTFVEQQKSKLVTTLQHNGIRFAILKGGAIAKPLYKERWYYRSMADVDILIDPVQINLAFAHLKALGFSDVSLHPLGDSELEQIETCHQQLNDFEHSLQLPNRQLYLDIHWKLKGENLIPISYQSLFNCFIDDNGCIFRLNEPIEFIHLCVHGMSDGWRNLKGMVDVLYYAENISDWTVINETAEQLGISHNVNVSLAICDFLYGTSFCAKQLNDRERTLFGFITKGFSRDNEFPCIHSYLDRRNLFRFVQSTLSWWLSLSSDLIPTTKIVKDLLTPNRADINEGQLTKNDQYSWRFLIRINRVLKKYLQIKG